MDGILGPGDGNVSELAAAAAAAAAACLCATPSSAAMTRVNSSRTKTY